MLLKVKDLVVKYGPIEAIKGISVEVAAGDIVVVIGANGAGKSTLLNTISGLVKPAGGEIWFDGTRIDKLPAERIVGLGIAQIPERRRLFPGLNVLETLQIGATLQKDRKVVERTLEQVFGLFPILKERTKQRSTALSGGQQQMLAVGRALMSKPKLLLADELSLGLAPVMVRNLYELFGELNRTTGLTLLLVEQNTKTALEVGRYGYLLDNGRTVLQGEAKELANSNLVKETYMGMRRNTEANGKRS
jgi:branched-chain amino acid transport system ATP-binding protein